MQNTENLKENIFFECKNLLEKLHQIENAESLVAEQNNIYLLLEKVSLLKNINFISGKISEKLNEDLDKNILEKKEAENHIQQLKEEYWKTLEEKENEIAELISKLRSISENKLEDTKLKLPMEDLYISTDNIKKETEVTELEESIVNEEITPLIEIKEEKKITQLEKEENRRKIIEFNRKDEKVAENAPVFEDFKTETHAEKKFRLGKIKGLSIVKSLFDDDFLDEEKSETLSKSTLQNSNMATDFMEAEKPKQDFRIDLNDKVAFTKLLFKGDEDDLKSTLKKLNSYKTLDEAKEYLSELYYENGWQKVDDYAQRLWILVENKFI
ncbi:hypothetical protein [Halpernia sp.]|uniref:hypothetical protein n=1 Tax=Halpernia sp. TaxID=2782209 RepID=UPI003A9106C5